MSHAPAPFFPLLFMSPGKSAYVVVAALCVLAASFWHVFVKADRKGWEVLVPGWNMVVLMRLIGRPWWWALGLFPGPFSLWLAGLVVRETHSRLFWALALPGVMLAGWMHYRISFSLARSFGRSRRFGWRLTWLPFVYIPVLGFGYSEYVGPARRGKHCKPEIQAQAGADNGADAAAGGEGGGSPANPA